ncbi:MAG TPA: hypothetical protein VJ915_09685 [Balneolaceae bacterium]|nr:hypothetical protein [Balneolaceae bacterium]
MNKWRSVFYNFDTTGFYKAFLKEQKLARESFIDQKYAVNQWLQIEYPDYFRD